MDNDKKTIVNNNDNEETVFDNNEKTQTTKSIPSQTKTQTTAKKKSPKWKVATASGAGILLGSVSALFADSLIDNSDTVSEENVNDTDTDDAVAGSSHAVWTDGEVEMASGVSDDMSFDEAFATAREEVGAGGVFEWHGNAYNTYYANEWDNMSPAERNEYFSHLNFGGNPDDNDLNDTPDDNDLDDTHDDNDLDDTPDANTETDNWLDDIELAENETGNEVGETEDDHEGEAGVLEDNTGLDGDSGVEVLGDVPDEPGVYEGENETVTIIDIDGDGQLDVIAADLNHDGMISSDELIDISDDGLDSEEFAEVPDDMDADGDYDNSLAMTDESLFMDDSDMPDYVNDADTTDYDGLV